ncbi:uncharacterized protein HD556DRAFT_1447611 [Suillus plorans]|uniref:Uncharacterized protein n=1 Tax=Suillus plorans TaxID=116603 RepID=A0A9P7AGA3_9AGAM|nr:uncharacterized protein HD556DRAFT_1447611 [Suillus plorans]KAG1788766.1 hypothetical protein HD556DRAFT_1447611 [Suillus plorans]
MTSSKRATKPAQVDPYQALNTAQPSRQATTGKIRGKAKEPKKADRDERQREEIRFNLGYSFRDTRSGASARRRQARVREDGDTSDYPPPPTYEVATSPTLSSLASSALASSTFVAGVHIHPEHLPVSNRTSSSGSTQPAATHDNIIMHTDSPISAVTATPLSMSIPTPALSPLMMPLHVPSPTLAHTPNLSSGSCAFPVPVHQKALLDDDESSIELVDVDPPQRWEMDRQRGVPLEERVTRHHQRSVESHVPAVPQRTRLFSQAPKRSPTSQSRFANSRLSLRIPEDQDPYPDDRSVQAASDASSPVTPKHKLPLPSLPLSPSRIFHRSQSPQPSSSVISLLRNPNPFFKSTPSLLNLSSPSALHGHGDHHFSRKLFHRKQKERAAESLEDWEVLDRTDSSHSSLEDSPAHPSPPSPAPAPRSGGFAETWSYPDVFTEDTRNSNTNRHPYCSSIRTILPAEDRPQRPASPPFVNRHVRRRTNSSLRSDHTCASSAPVSPISSSSASLFSSSSLSLATVGRTLPSFSQQDLGVCDELERSRHPARGITLRDSPTLSSLSLSQPSVGRALTSFSQMNLGTHQVQHEHVRSHSTPRAVVQPELPKTTRTHTRASPTSASEVTYIDYNVVPGTPTPAPNNSLPTRSATERVTRRRTPARREEILIHRGRSLSRELEMRSAPAYSAIFPSGPPTPPPESHTPPYSPAPASPRRHYAGRPLPQTPSTSPSLTWLVGRTPDEKTPTVPVLHHPRAISKNLHVPEGLLIDLDDDSLDPISPSSSSYTPPLPAHTPPLPNRTPPLPDSTPMIPDRTPPARTPPPLPIDYLEDDIDSDSVTVGSSSPRGPLTPTSTTLPSSFTVTTPASEYITGLVGSLGDDHPRDDGSNYDVSIRDAQFSGPYLKSPTCAGPPPHRRFYRSCHIASQS